jgi:hypothetical protein
MSRGKRGSHSSGSSAATTRQANSVLGSLARQLRGHTDVRHRELQLLALRAQPNLLGIVIQEFRVAGSTNATSAKNAENAGNATSSASSNSAPSASAGTSGKVQVSRGTWDPKPTLQWVSAASHLATLLKSCSVSRPKKPSTSSSGSRPPTATSRNHGRNSGGSSGSGADGGVGDEKDDAEHARAYAELTSKVAEESNTAAVNGRAIDGALSAQLPQGLGRKELCRALTHDNALVRKVEYDNDMRSLFIFPFQSIFHGPSSSPDLSLSIPFPCTAGVRFDQRSSTPLRQDCQSVRHG